MTATATPSMRCVDARTWMVGRYGCAMRWRFDGSKSARYSAPNLVETTP